MHRIMGRSARGQLIFSFRDLPPNISQQYVIVIRKYISFLQPHFCALKRKLISICYLVYSFLLVHYKYLPQLTHNNMHLEIFWRNVKNPKDYSVELLTILLLLHKCTIWHVLITWRYKFSFHKHLFTSDVLLAFSPTRNVTEGQGEQLHSKSCLIFVGLIWKSSGMWCIRQLARGNCKGWSMQGTDKNFRK